MAPMLDAIGVIATFALQHVHEIIASNRVIWVGLLEVLFFSKHDGVRWFQNCSFFYGSAWVRSAHVLGETVRRQLIEEIIVPAIDEVAALGAVGRVGCAWIGQRRAALGVGRADQKIGCAIVFH